MRTWHHSAQLTDQNKPALDPAAPQLLLVFLLLTLAEHEERERPGRPAPRWEGTASGAVAVRGTVWPREPGASAHSLGSHLGEW